MTMTGGGGAIVGGALVGSAILAEETGALDGVKDSFNEWLMTGRDGALIKDDGSSNDEPEINNPVTGSGSIAAGGAPGLPPDDDDNKNSNKNNENSQQPSEAGKGNVDSKNSEKIKTTWHEGSKNTPEESLQKHFEKHGKEVNAETAEQYLNKAKAFSENLKGARVVVNVGKYTEGVTRYYKNGKYIDIAPDKRIISFGKQ